MVIILFMAHLWSFMFYFKHECPRMVMNNILMAHLWSFMFYYYKHECPRMVMNIIYNGPFMLTHGYKNNRPLWMVAGSSLDDVCFSDLRNT